MGTNRRLNIKKKHGLKGLHPQALVSFTKVRRLVGQNVELNEAADEDGNSLLQVAILQNCCKGIIKYLVSHRADLKYTNNKGATAIHLCCMHRKLIALKSLLHLFTDSNMVVDSSGCTPLHHACRNGCVKMVTSVLNNGSFESSLASKTNKGNTALHEVCYNTDLQACQILEELIRRGGSVNEQNYQGELPLHIACREQCDAHMVNILLASTEDVNRTDKHNQTSLHHAVVNTMPDSFYILTALVKAGVDVAIVDNNGDTAFTKGLQRDTENILKFLVNATAHLPTNSWEIHPWGWCDRLLELLTSDDSILPAKTQDGNGNTLLHHINQKMNYQLVRYLSESAAIDVNIQNNQGVTPMHIVAEKDMHDVCSNFFRAGGQVTTVDYQSRVPFLIAFENNNQKYIYLSMKQQSYEIISFLELNPALIPVALKQNRAGSNLLHFACRYNCFELVRFLVNKGNVNQKSSGGCNSPLHKVAKAPRYNRLLVIQEDQRRRSTEQIIETLLNSGGQLNGENRKGLTPLAVAFLARNKYAFYRLLNIACCDKQIESGGVIFGQIDINKKNYDGDSPLLLACRLGCPTKVIQTLLDLGADCSLCTSFTRRPLQFAADHKDMSTVELLLSHGGNYTRVRKLKLESYEVSTKSLHLLTQGCQFAMLRQFFQSNVAVDINTLYNGATLLHTAVLGKVFIHTLAVASVLEYGADVNAVDAESCNSCESVLSRFSVYGQPVTRSNKCHLSIYQMAVLRLLASAGSTIDINKLSACKIKEITADSLINVNTLDFIQCLMLLGVKKANLHNSLTEAFPQLFSVPNSLQQCCAIVLRQNMKPNTWVGIQKVTLPDALKSYVICGYQRNSLISTDIKFQF